MELGGACGATTGSTAAELQAMAAKVTEIPRNASLIRDPVSPITDGDSYRMKQARAKGGTKINHY